MGPDTRYLPVWFCDPSLPGRKCHNVPCHGHKATEAQLIVAKVLCRVDGVDWWDLTQSQARQQLRRAWRVLTDIRAGTPVDTPAPVRD